MTPLTLPAGIRIKIMSKKLQLNGFELKPNEEYKL
jgi:hypothetical protein